jgi:electron-transferring-flavoprotein dehydrogenase
VLQEFKKHPMVARLFEGGKMIRYGAKSLPYGGWWSIPPVAGDGWMILGDSAGFLNSQRLKGIHLAIKYGMLAAEMILDTMVANDFSRNTLSLFQSRVEKSWIMKELCPVRNFHQGFEHGFWHGLFHATIQQITGGRGMHARYTSTAGHRRLKKLSEIPPDGGAEAHLIGDAKGDGNLTYDKLTDLYHSGTKHEEDQPSHLIVHDTNICSACCTVEFGNPCTHFRPASVYEMEEAADAPNGKHLHLNPSNCVHCRTCDIIDPYEIITWVAPEGGGGPNYEGM